MTYILLSSNKDDQEASRSFTEFTSPSVMSQRIIDYFEDWLMLKDPNPMAPLDETPLEYTSDDLFLFLDTFFEELVCLEETEETKLWIPHTTEWIKEQVYFELRNQSHRNVMQDQTNLHNNKPSSNEMEVEDTNGHDQFVY